MKIQINFKNKKLLLDVKICKSIFQKIKGLMFCRRETAKPLLFKFKRPTPMKIHSFFCPKFLAVWLDQKNKIIEAKIIKPFTLSVKPKKEFSKLIEIPLSRNYYSKVKFIVGEKFKNKKVF